LNGIPGGNPYPTTAPGPASFTPGHGMPNGRTPGDFVGSPHPMPQAAHPGYFDGGHSVPGGGGHNGMGMGGSPMMARQMSMGHAGMTPGMGGMPGMSPGMGGMGMNPAMGGMAGHGPVGDFIGSPAGTPGRGHPEMGGGW
jgi:hypothetical protein